MGFFVPQAVGAGQVFQFERGAAVFFFGPLNALWAQGIDHAHDIQNVPAATAVLPFAGVGVDQVAPKQVAGDFIVKADGVVAHADGARLAEGRLDLAGKAVFAHALGQALLGGEAGD